MQEITGRTHIKWPAQAISKTIHPVLGHCLPKVMQVVGKMSLKILQKKEAKIENVTFQINLLIREGVGKKGGKVWSFLVLVREGVANGNEKAILLFWGLNEGQKWLKMA